MEEEPHSPTKRGSQDIKDAQDQDLSRENGHWERGESALQLAFSQLRVQELLRSATTSKAWRRMIDRNAIAWTTAMWELDPTAVLGPEGAKEAVARLMITAGASNVGLKGQLWLTLAGRLASHQCVNNNATCPRRAFEMNISTLDRLCAECKDAIDSEHEFETLPNYFMFDKEPSAQVSTPQELLDAMFNLQEGACIQVSGTLHFTEEDTGLLKNWSEEDPTHFRYRIMGEDKNAGIVSRHKDTTLFLSCCLLEGLNITIGYDDENPCMCAECSDENGHQLTAEDWEEGEDWYHAIQVNSNSRVMLKDCNIKGCFGTTLYVNAGGSLAAEGCVITSKGRAPCIFLDDEGVDEGARPPCLNCRDSTFMRNYWGCRVSNNVEEEVVHDFIAVNTFEDEDLGAWEVEAAKAKMRLQELRGVGVKEDSPSMKQMKAVVDEQAGWLHKRKLGVGCADPNPQGGSVQGYECHDAVLQPWRCGWATEFRGSF